MIAIYKQAQTLYPDVDLDPLTRQIDRNPSISAYYYRYLSYYEAEKFDLALAELNKIIKLDSNYPYAYWYKGRILLEREEKQKAIANLETAAKLFKEQRNTRKQKQLVGNYNVDAKNPDGSSYYGKASIKYKNGRYQIIWEIKGETYYGSGILENDLLKINWDGDLVIYFIKEDGTLLGTWANGRGTDNLSVD